MEIIKDLFLGIDKYEGKEIEVEGWVRTVRDSKTFGFIELNDGSFFKNVQIVFDDKLKNFSEVQKVSISSSLIVKASINFKF